MHTAFEIFVASSFLFFASACGLIWRSGAVALVRTVAGLLAGAAALDRFAHARGAVVVSASGDYQKKPNAAAEALKNVRRSAELLIVGSSLSSLLVLEGFAYGTVCPSGYGAASAYACASAYARGFSTGTALMCIVAQVRRHKSLA